MMTFRAAIYLIVSVLSLSVAWGKAPDVRQPQKQAPGTPPGGTEIRQIPQPAAPVIKHLGLFGPVPGGKETLGLVQLLSPSLERVGTTVYLSSNRPDLASVPPAIIVPTNTTDVGFKVTTSPVTAPTPVTITACAKPCGQAGVETKTATVIVRPPVLSNLACTPQQVPVGTKTTCTVWLDGKLAAYTYVPLSSPEYGTNLPSQIFLQIRVPAGEVKGSREVTGINPGPQPRPVTINASYEGVSKSTHLTVGPAYLKNVTSLGFAFQGGQGVAPLRVDLYASAPSGGLPYRVEVPALGFRKDDKVPPGTLSEDTYLNLQPAAADTPVQITVTTNFQEAKDTKATTVTVRAARLDHLWAYWKCKERGQTIEGPIPGGTGRIPVWVGTPGQDCEYLGGVGLNTSPTSGSFKTVELQNMPVGGVELKVEAWLQGKAPASGAPVALTYSSSLVTGPPEVKIPKNDWAEDFRVKVYPCPQAECPGWIRATYLGQTLELPLKVRSQ